MAGDEIGNTLGAFLRKKKKLIQLSDCPIPFPLKTVLDINLYENVGEGGR